MLKKPRNAQYYYTIDTFATTFLCSYKNLFYICTQKFRKQQFQQSNPSTTEAHEAFLCRLGFSVLYKKKQAIGNKPIACISDY